MRGIFFDEDSARSAALVLTRGGYEATVLRERLHGEDDDEDHPWAVLTDAPEVQLEMLVEMYDGWLDVDDRPDTASSGGSGSSTSEPTPLPLPDQPKRIKRPQ